MGPSWDVRTEQGFFAVLGAALCYVINVGWAVIAYAHTLSGHRGPHVASEHPELAPKPKFVTGEGTVTAVAPRSSRLR